MSNKITEVDILVERRPGHLTKGIRHQLDAGWDWDGKVMLSSTDGFVAVFTKSEEEVAPKKRAPAKPKAVAAPPKVGMAAKDVSITSGSPSTS